MTRLSFGVQSTAAHVLAGLGRRHRPEPLARLAAVVADAGFDTWNLDLIFGAAAETDADWERHPGRRAGGLGPPPHVSAYALTVEPGTPLAGDPGRHPDDDVQARRYEQAEAVLSAAGYRWEEISNWARPGHGCRAQPPLLEPGRLPGHRVGRPLPPGRAAVVERPHPRPLRRRRRGRALDGGRRGGAHRGPAGVRAAGPLAAHPGGRARPSALPDDPELDGPGRAVRTAVRAHRPGPAAGQRGDRAPGGGRRTRPTDPAPDDRGTADRRGPDGVGAVSDART